jgi:predicted transcriptional regulator YdeE
VHQNLAKQIPNRINPGTIFCVYTNYESDFTGEYTYFIGEEVSSFTGISEGFTALIIPAQKYIKFTNRPGPMPKVCIEMWKAIWEMSPADLGGSRAYIADFEVYDERSNNHDNVTLDIYIGIKG